MNLSKSLLVTVITASIFVLTLIPVESAVAQWSLGASYEIRDEDPTNGFGLRLERGILRGLPVVSLSLRAHFSYFNEEIETYRNVSAPATLDSYDFGLAALGGVNVGLLKPYAGLGIGSESFEAVQNNAEQFELDDSSLYWNIFVGAEVSPIPIVKPFIEYRFTRLFDDDFGLDDDELDYRQNGRLAVGVMIHF